MPQWKAFVGENCNLLGMGKNPKSFVFIFTSDPSSKVLGALNTLSELDASSHGEQAAQDWIAFADVHLPP